MKTLQSYKKWAKTWSRSQLIFLYVMALVPTLTAIFIYTQLSATYDEARYWQNHSRMQSLQLRQFVFGNGLTNTQFNTNTPTK